MIEALILALALSMDAFAVSIGLGAKVPCGADGCDRRELALKAGVYFGFFQALMPLFGYLAGVGMMHYIEVFDHWIAFGLLSIIGGKMLYESFQDGVEDEITRVSNRMLMILAVATSIDAAAAGFTLQLINLNPYISMALIGFVTFLLSAIGVYVGAHGEVWLENRAEMLGGIVLIVIGIKILAQHLGFL